MRYVKGTEPCTQIPAWALSVKVLICKERLRPLVYVLGSHCRFLSWESASYTCLPQIHLIKASVCAWHRVSA